MSYFLGCVTDAAWLWLGYALVECIFLNTKKKHLCQEKSVIVNVGGTVLKLCQNSVFRWWNSVKLLYFWFIQVGYCVFVVHVFILKTFDAARWILYSCVSTRACAFFKRVFFQETKNSAIQSTFHTEYENCKLTVFASYENGMFSYSVFPHFFSMFLRVNLQLLFLFSGISTQHHVHFMCVWRLFLLFVYLGACVFFFL